MERWNAPCIGVSLPWPACLHSLSQLASTLIATCNFVSLFDWPAAVEKQVSRFLVLFLHRIHMEINSTFFSRGRSLHMIISIIMTTPHASICRNYTSSRVLNRLMVLIGISGRGASFNENGEVRKEEEVIVCL